MKKSTTNSYKLKTLGKVYQKLLRRFTSQTRMPTGIRKPLRKVYQTTGMVEPYPNTPSRGVTRDRIKRGVVTSSLLIRERVKKGDSDFIAAKTLALSS